MISNPTIFLIILIILGGGGFLAVSIGRDLLRVLIDQRWPPDPEPEYWETTAFHPLPARRPRPLTEDEWREQTIAQVHDWLPAWDWGDAISPTPGVPNEAPSHPYRRSLWSRDPGSHLPSRSASVQDVHVSDDDHHDDDRAVINILGAGHIVLGAGHHDPDDIRDAVHRADHLNLPPNHATSEHYLHDDGFLDLDHPRP